MSGTPEGSYLTIARDAGRVEHDRGARGVVLRDVRRGAQVTMRLAVDPGRVGELVGLLGELTAGTTPVSEVGIVWTDDD